MTRTFGSSDKMIETLNYGSHLPALIACVAVCEGPVLEIGCGHFSTPCLHSLCAALRLPLFTTEIEDSWREQFMPYHGPAHSVIKQTDALLEMYANRQWGVVLVDDQPDKRMDHLNLFFNSARFVLFHDSNYPGYEGLADWIAARNCYNRTYTRIGPYTLAVSKNRPIPEF